MSILSSRRRHQRRAPGMSYDVSLLDADHVSLLNAEHQRAIARVTGVARSWLQRFVNDLYRDEARWRVEPAPEPAVKKNATS